MKPIVGLAAVLCCLVLSASESNDPLFDFMYDQFSAAFITPKDSGESPESLILAVPGFGLAPAALKTPSYEISELVDYVPLATSRVYQRTGFRYSTLYEQLLANANVTKFQVMADKDKALDARRALFDKDRPNQPKPEYAAYLKYREEYVSAEDAKTNALEDSKNTHKPVPPGLDQALETARKNWETNGSKARIDTALDTLHKAYDSNSQVLFYNLGAQLEKARFQGTAPQPWYPVTTYPPVEEWLSGTGWHPRVFEQVAGAAAPKGWPQTLKLSVEVKRVAVSRTWMDPAIFRIHTWKFLPTNHFEILSTGNPADPEPGPMPILVTGLLLARKLVLTGYTATDKNGSDHLGPFRLKTASGTSITEKDVQVIGFFYQVVPKCPTPDPKFFR